ncbi:MAG: PD-(D/E)XK nuclease family protein [candidate division KSB1 bacterium]|nr:PD-(D/E)XK nuclease family protein [candidate division KSB1 bacterium]MDZ7303220.1 PD-(D/E)XK nuclease family protein [candidate division KSB1 bacterium]MDZ7312168.1 PD-(D/E)XK nuclease family protein [candidate division KSB1 bacterium]
MENQADIIWSYSRRETLETCPKKYYYEYYGTNQKTAKGEVDKAALVQAKAWKNRYLRTGEILHLIIRTYLNDCRNGSRWTINGLIEWARKIFRGDRLYSSGRLSQAELLKCKFKPVPLLEYRFQTQTAEALCLEAEERLVQAIMNFATRSELASFRKGAKYSDAAIEKKFVFKNGIFHGCGQIDLVYPIDDKIVIADWKIGAAGSAEESLQLAFYGLWAVDEYDCNLDKIKLFRVDLAEAKVRQYSFTSNSLNHVKARILQDLESMNMLHRYGVNANAKAFTPCAQPKICTLCPYQKICPKE